MAKTTELRIGGVAYRMNIEAEQETRLKEVAALWETYVSKMIKNAPKMGRDQMLVMAGLMMADDLYSETTGASVEDEAMTNFHNRLAEKLESLCQKLDA